MSCFSFVSGRLAVIVVDFDILSEPLRTITSFRRNGSSRKLPSLLYIKNVVAADMKGQGPFDERHFIFFLLPLSAVVQLLGDRTVLGSAILKGALHRCNRGHQAAPPHQC